MSWEFFTEPKQEGNMITSADVRELFEALDERLKCAYGEDSEVVNTDPGVVTKRVQSRMRRGSVLTELVHPLHQAIAIASHGRFVFMDGGLFIRFGSETVAQDRRVLKIAANELGWSDEFFESVVGGNIMNDERRYVIDIHYFNLCRKALQLMEYVNPTSSYPSQQINAFHVVDLGKRLFPQEGETDWEDAKDAFHAKEWGVDQPGIGSVQVGIETARDSSCRYSIVGRRYHAEIELADKWAELGYELFIQRFTRIPFPSNPPQFQFNDATWILELNEEEVINQVLVEPSVLATPHVESVKGPEATETEITILEYMKETVDRGAMDDLARPQNDEGSCGDSDSERFQTPLLLNSPSTTQFPATAVIFAGKPEFDYGPDPE